MNTKSQLQQFINIGLHLGGAALPNATKGWGTYDLDIVARRYNRSFYDTNKIWYNINNMLTFLKNSPEARTVFGSFTKDYYQMLNEASLRCHATFYGDGENWIYGQYTTFLKRQDFEIAYLPDIIHNHALFREFKPSFAVIIGIKTTDSIENIDYPLIGDPANAYHVLYYTHLISYIIARSKIKVEEIEIKD